MKIFFEPSTKKFNVAARTSVEKNTRKNLVHPLPNGKLRKNLTFFFNQDEKKFNGTQSKKTHGGIWFIHVLPET